MVLFGDHRVAYHGTTVAVEDGEEVRWRAEHVGVEVAVPGEEAHGHIGEVQRCCGSEPNGLGERAGCGV
jgi:hypothetical protein